MEATGHEAEARSPLNRKHRKTHLRLPDLEFSKTQFGVVPKSGTSLAQIVTSASTSASRSGLCFRSSHFNCLEELTNLRQPTQRKHRESERYNSEHQHMNRDGADAWHTHAGKPKLIEMVCR
jgi:hypothetical protein